MQVTLVDSWVGKIRWRSDRLPTAVFLGFSGGSAGKESACKVGDLCSIPGLGRSPGEGNDHPLQYSGLKNSRDCIICEVAKSWSQLSNFHFHLLLPQFSSVTQSCLTLCDPIQSMDFSRPEYWSV